MELWDEIPGDFLRNFEMVDPNLTLLIYMVTLTKGWPNQCWEICEATPNQSFIIPAKHN